jgi:hypothetical protein
MGSSGTSTTSGFEKSNNESGDSDEEKGTATVITPNPEDDEYPKGASLVFIIVALALSIFLVSLDMVRFFFADNPYSSADFDRQLSPQLSQK